MVSSISNQDGATTKEDEVAVYGKAAEYWTFQIKFGLVYVKFQD